VAAGPLSRAATSRNPGDLDAICDKLAEEIKEGQHERREAA